MASRVLKRGLSCQGEGQWLKYGFARVNLPIYSLAFSDDVFEKRQYATCLHAQFTGASITQQIVKRKGVGQNVLVK